MKSRKEARKCRNTGVFIGVFERFCKGYIGVKNSIVYSLQSEKINVGKKIIYWAELPSVNHRYG